MRAAVMRGDAFVVEDRPLPKAGPGNVLARVRACGICGSDLHYFHHAPDIIAQAGRLGAATGEMEQVLRSGPVLGHEFVCELVEYGPDTEHSLPIGSRVVSMPFVVKGGAPVLVGSRADLGGAYAEYMELTESLLLPVPETVSDDAAALGFRTILASDLSPARRRLALELGATETIDPATDDVVARAAGSVAGRGLVIFENTGAAGMLNRLVIGAPAGSQIVVTGIANGDESLIPMIAIAKELLLRFVIYYAAEEFAEALELIRTEQVNWRPLITGKVGLAGVTQAFSDLSDPERHAKILIDPWL